VEPGLTNYWGYQTIGFFAPEPRYMGRGQLREFQHHGAPLHAAGIEVILDVVYNHTGEGNELGPTLSLSRARQPQLLPPGRRRAPLHQRHRHRQHAEPDHPMVLRMVMDSLRYWVEVMRVDGFRFDLPHAGARGARVRSECRAGSSPRSGRTRCWPRQADRRALGHRAGRLSAGRLPASLPAEWNDKFRDGVRRFWRGDAGRRPTGRGSPARPTFDHSGAPPPVLGQLHHRA
jgi:isoamylase